MFYIEFGGIEGVWLLDILCARRFIMFSKSVVVSPVSHALFSLRSEEELPYHNAALERVRPACCAHRYWWLCSSEEGACHPRDLCAASCANAAVSGGIGCSACHCKEELNDWEILWGALRGLLVAGQVAVTGGARTLHRSLSAFRAPGRGACEGPSC